MPSIKPYKGTQPTTADSRRQEDSLVALSSQLVRNPFLEGRLIEVSIPVSGHVTIEHGLGVVPTCIWPVYTRDSNAGLPVDEGSDSRFLRLRVTQGFSYTGRLWVS